MTAARRKTILLIAKVLIAAGLLAWVLSGVHWRDYVVDAEGQDYAVLAERTGPDGRAAAFEVRSGPLWRPETRTLPAEDCRPVPGTDQLRRAGFATTVANLRLPWLLAGFALFLGNMVVIAMRWWLLLRVVTIHITPWEAVRLSFLGTYFSLVVPGVVSGDIVKAYYASKHTPAKAAAAVSVFMDRAMGLMQLTLMATVMLLIVWATGLVAFETLRFPAGLLAVMVAALVVGFAFLFSPSLRRVLGVDRLYGRLPLAGHLAVAGRAIRQYRGNVRRLIEAMGITLVGQSLWIGAMILAGRSLGLETSWYAYFLYVPLIFAIAAVPLTPGGLGLVEKFFLVFFVSGAVSASEVLALALLVRLMPMFWSLPGAVVAVTGAKVPPAKDIQAELGLKDAGAEIPAPPPGD